MVTNQALELLKQFEGYSPTAYQDSAGIWTIGCGTIKWADGRPVKQGDTITEPEAATALRRHADGDAQAVDSQTAYLDLNQNQKDALVSFTYNLGRGGLKQLTKNGTRTAEEIAAAIPLYNKAGGRVIRGLQNRRAKEAELFSQSLREGSSPVSPQANPLTPQGTQQSSSTPSRGSSSSSREPSRGNPQLEAVAQKLIHQNFKNGGIVKLKCMKDGGIV